jgi:hypothetical protein
MYNYDPDQSSTLTSTIPIENTLTIHNRRAPYSREMFNSYSTLKKQYDTLTDLID